MSICSVFCALYSNAFQCRFAQITNWEIFIVEDEFCIFVAARLLKKSLLIDVGSLPSISFQVSFDLEFCFESVSAIEEIKARGFISRLEISS